MSSQQQFSETTANISNKNDTDAHNRPPSISNHDYIPMHGNSVSIVDIGSNSGDTLSTIDSTASSTVYNNQSTTVNSSALTKITTNSSSHIYPNNIIKNRVCLTNLSPNITEEQIRKYFSQFGAINKVKIVRDKAKSCGLTSTYALMCYFSHEFVDAAVRMRHHSFDNEVIIASYCAKKAVDIEACQNDTLSTTSAVSTQPSINNDTPCPSIVSSLPSSLNHNDSLPKTSSSTTVTANNLDSIQTMPKSQHISSSSMSTLSKSQTTNTIENNTSFNNISNKSDGFLQNREANNNINNSSNNKTDTIGTISDNNNFINKSNYKSESETIKPNTQSSFNSAINTPIDEDNYLIVQGPDGEERKVIPKRVYITGLAPQINIEHFLRYFKQFGTITEHLVSRDYNGDIKNFAFLTYDTQEAANAVLEKKTHLLDDISLKSNYATFTPQLKKQIKLQGLTAEITRDNILSYYQQFGPLASLKIINDPNCSSEYNTYDPRKETFAFLRFSNNSDTYKAMHYNYLENCFDSPQKITLDNISSSPVTRNHRTLHKIIPNVITEVLLSNVKSDDTPQLNGSSRLNYHSNNNYRNKNQNQNNRNKCYNNNTININNNNNNNDQSTYQKSMYQPQKSQLLSLTQPQQRQKYSRHQVKQQPLHIEQQHLGVAPQNNIRYYSGPPNQPIYVPIPINNDNICQTYNFPQGVNNNINTMQNHQQQNIISSLQNQSNQGYIQTLYQPIPPYYTQIVNSQIPSINTIPFSPPPPPHDTTNNPSIYDQNVNNHRSIQRQNRDRSYNTNSNNNNNNNKNNYYRNNR